MKTKLSKDAQNVKDRLIMELPEILRKFTFKWKQDLVLGFCLGAGLSFEEATAIRAEAVDHDFWQR